MHCNYFFKVSHFQAQAEELLTRLYGLTASSVKEFNSYDDRNFYFTVKESGDDIWPHGYILKVSIPGGAFLSEMNTNCLLDHQQQRL